MVQQSSLQNFSEIARISEIGPTKNHFLTLHSSCHKLQSIHHGQITAYHKASRITERMNKTITHTALIQLLFVLQILCLIPLTGLGQENKIKFSGKVSFVSDAPLEKIAATSDKLQGIINLSTNQFAFSVKVRTFEGFNSLLQQEHFNENYLESDKYPSISYTGKLLDKWDSQTPGTYKVRSKGYLECHGIKKEQIIENTITVTKSQISVSSKFSVLLADYGISIPQIVQKKISEEILITVTASQSK